MANGGHVTIGATLNGEQAAISVSDNGCGIAPDHLNAIFDPLFTTKPKGIGLGLAVCKNLIEANGGAIEANSEQGTGTTFTLRLSLAAEGTCHQELTERLT